MFFIESGQQCGILGKNLILKTRLKISFSENSELFRFFNFLERLTALIEISGLHIFKINTMCYLLCSYPV